MWKQISGFKNCTNIGMSLSLIHIFAVFIPIEHFADTFDFADGRFSGFLSDTKIKDIDAVSYTHLDVYKRQVQQ